MTHMLHNKVILVTGALGRIPFAAVTEFLAQGARVIANDVRPVVEHGAMQRLHDEYDDDRLQFVQADVAEESDVEPLYADICARFGCLNGLFHNAYTQHRRRVDEYTPDEWCSVIAGTLGSTFLVCRAGIPLIAKSGGGSIVNTSSILSQQPRALDGAYGAAKAAINLLTRVIAAENAVHGIRANAILPGDIKQQTGDVPSSQPAAWLGRSGTPEEVAKLACFLMSDEASYITGSLISIDGGLRV